MPDEKDLLEEQHVQQTIAITLLQIRDYLATILVALDSNSAELERMADSLGTIHESGAVFLPPPHILNSKIQQAESDEQ